MSEVLDQIPELPSLGQRWTVRRKAAVIEAVRGDWVPIEEICRLYTLSVDEFLAWERDIDRHGCSRPARHALSNLPRYRCAAAVGRIWTAPAQ